MTSKTDFVLGPDIHDFNATTVRVEYDSDDGASYFAEYFGDGALQVSLRKSGVPEFISRIEARGLSHRVGTDWDLTAN